MRATGWGQRPGPCRRAVLRAALLTPGFGYATPRVLSARPTQPRVLGQIIVEADDSDVTTSGAHDRPVDWVQGDASPGTRQRPSGDVLREPGRTYAPVDMQEGSSVRRALTNRTGRSDVILDRASAHRPRAGRVPDGGVGGDAQHAQGSSCPGGGCAARRPRCALATQMSLLTAQYWADLRFFLITQPLVQAGLLVRSNRAGRGFYCCDCAWWRVSTCQRRSKSWACSAMYSAVRGRLCCAVIP